MPYARNHAATGTDGEAMWIFGGRKGKNVPSDGYDTIQVYFPSNNTWINSNDDTNVLPNPLPVGRGGTGHSAYEKKKNQKIKNSKKKKIFENSKNI